MHVIVNSTGPEVSFVEIVSIKNLISAINMGLYLFSILLVFFSTDFNFI